MARIPESLGLHTLWLLLLICLASLYIGKKYNKKKRVTFYDRLEYIENDEPKEARRNDELHAWVFRQMKFQNTLREVAPIIETNLRLKLKRLPT